MQIDSAATALQTEGVRVAVVDTTVAEVECDQHPSSLAARVFLPYPAETVLHSRRFR
eukprot:m.162830 g.162830  ORF g.162830 m.162830 type:complete len:57 (-) comp18084_c0_seq1:864-1034(-)